MRAEGGGGGGGGGSPGGGGGGGGVMSSVKAAEMQAMIDKLNEACRIAKEEAEQARKERDEAQGSIEATYAEGRALIAKAREEKEELVQQREAERGIVKKAMDELKSLQIQGQEKDAVIMKALEKMKALNLDCATAKEERRKADDTARTLGSERAELDAKLRRLENQLANAEAKLALAGSSSPRPGAPGAAPEQAAAAGGGVEVRFWT